MDEISQKKSLGEVRLSIFPNDTGERRKYVIVCPGGGYAHCVTGQEGYPIAAKLNEMGYTAFVLEYRTGFHCGGYAPMQDLARAVKNIEEHLGTERIRRDYAICGFSAGGIWPASSGKGTRLCEIRGKKARRADSGLSLDQCEPLAGSSLLEYLEGTDRNLALEADSSLCSPLRQQKPRSSLCVQNYITPDYPPTLHDGRQHDLLVPASHHAAVLKLGAETGRCAACL